MSIAKRCLEQVDRENLQAELTAALLAACPSSDLLLDPADLKSRLSAAMQPYIDRLLAAKIGMDKVKIEFDPDPALIDAGKIELKMTFPADTNCRLCRHHHYDFANPPDGEILVRCLKREDVALQIEDNDALVLMAYGCPWRSPIVDKN